MLANSDVVMGTETISHRDLAAMRQQIVVLTQQLHVQEQLQQQQAQIAAQRAELDAHNRRDAAEKKQASLERHRQALADQDRAHAAQRAHLQRMLDFAQGIPNKHDPASISITAKLREDYVSKQNPTGRLARQKAAISQRKEVTTLETTLTDSCKRLAQGRLTLKILETQVENDEKAVAGAPAEMLDKVQQRTEERERKEREAADKRKRKEREKAEKKQLQEAAADRSISPDLFQRAAYDGSSPQQLLSSYSPLPFLSLQSASASSSSPPAAAAAAASGGRRRPRQIASDDDADEAPPAVRRRLHILIDNEAEEATGQTPSPPSSEPEHGEDLDGQDSDQHSEKHQDSACDSE